jgi:hypothetical protein
MLREIKNPTSDASQTALKVPVYNPAFGEALISF